MIICGYSLDSNNCASTVCVTIEESLSCLSSTAPLVDSNPRHSSSAMLMLLSVVFLGLAVFLIYKFKRYAPLWFLLPAAHSLVDCISVTTLSIIDDIRAAHYGPINYNCALRFDVSPPLEVVDILAASFQCMKHMHRI